MSRIISFILIAFLYVFDDQVIAQREEYLKYEIKILEKLIRDTTRKERPSVYIFCPKNTLKKHFNRFSSLRISESTNKADFIIVKNLTVPLNEKKPALALDFRSLKYCPYCIGIFSWKNGRPMLIIFKEVITEFNIKLPSEYNYFIDSRKNVFVR